jgi:hypothetical protein
MCTYASYSEDASSTKQAVSLMGRLAYGATCAHYTAIIMRALTFAITCNPLGTLGKIQQTRGSTLLDRVDSFANWVFEAENSFDDERVPLDVVIEVEGRNLFIFTGPLLVRCLYACAVHPPDKELGGLNHVAPELAKNLGDILDGWRDQDLRITEAESDLHGPSLSDSPPVC